MNELETMDREIFLNGLSRSILLLVDMLHDLKGNLSAEQIHEITDSIIYLNREREDFIEKRKPRVMKVSEVSK